MADKKSKNFINKNTIVNYFGDGRYEVIAYHKSFLCLESSIIKDDEAEVREDCELENNRGRKFAERIYGDNKKILVPIRDNATISDLQKSIFDGGKRAQDNFYGYGLTNEWNYFITLTISPRIAAEHSLDIYDDEAVKSIWKGFRQKLQKYDKDVRILCVPERHEKGNLHFHALVGLNNPLPIIPMMPPSADYNTFDKSGKLAQLPETSSKYYIIPYYEKGKQLKSKMGDYLWVMSFFDFGINSLSIIDTSDSVRQIKSVNYLIGYTTKQGNIGYNKKRYFRTHNLSFKNKQVLKMNEKKLYAFLTDVEAKLYKKGDRFTVYRNFNVPENAEAPKLQDIHFEKPDAETSVPDFDEKFKLFMNVVLLGKHRDPKEREKLWNRISAMQVIDFDE